MQFRQYDPTKDTLKVGTVIKLGGREGNLVAECYEGSFEIQWGLEEKNIMYLKNFPLLEIGEEELTITWRLKEEIKEEYMKSHTREFFDWLDSLKEVE